FTPDGKALATASTDGCVKLWDVRTGKERAVYRHEEPVWDLAFSPDGKALATLTEHVSVWDLATGKARHFSPKDRLVLLWYSPDGRLLSLRHNHNPTEVLEVWDVVLGVKGREIEVPPHGNGPMTLALSPDRRTL